MATKRTFIGRPSKSHITPEAVDLFIRCKKLGPIYHDCISADVCRSSDEGKHCPECREYLVASCDLHSLLGRYPHQEDVCSTIGADEPPDWMANDARRLADYRQAVALRRELEKAAKSSMRDATAS